MNILFVYLIFIFGKCKPYFILVSVKDCVVPVLYYKLSYNLCTSLGMRRRGRREDLWDKGRLEP